MATDKDLIALLKEAYSNSSDLLEAQLKISEVNNEEILELRNSIERSKAKDRTINGLILTLLLIVSITFGSKIMISYKDWQISNNPCSSQYIINDNNLIGEKK